MYLKMQGKNTGFEHSIKEKYNPLKFKYLKDQDLSLNFQKGKCSTLQDILIITCKK